MTCIIGGKCKDGVVLIGDKKITNEKTNQVEYMEKLFVFKKDNFYYPIVVGSSGTVGLYDKFKTKAIEALEEIKSPGFDSNGFDKGYDISVSGIIYRYSSGVNSTSKEIILDPYLERLEKIIKEYKKEYSPEIFNVLFAAQVKYSGAVLRYISENGLS
jgi:hypothetical protein